VTPAWLHLGSVVERHWLAVGGPFAFFQVGKSGLRNNPSHLVGPPFPAFSSCFSAMMGWHLLHRSLDWMSYICLGWLKLRVGTVSSPAAQRKLKWWYIKWL